MDKEPKTSAAQLASAKKYLEKMKRINMALPPEKAKEIKDCAALAGLSITQSLLMCHENYQHGKMNNN